MTEIHTSLKYYKFTYYGFIKKICSFLRGGLLILKTKLYLNTKPSHIENIYDEYITN